MEVRADSPVLKQVPPRRVPQRDPDVLVYLLADEIHTGMVFPYEWLVESGFRPPANFPPNTRYVNMSWGARQAYIQHTWLTPWQAFRALCTPSPSVMEIIPFDYDVVDVCHFQHIWKKLVPRDRGPALAAFLNGCVSHGADGKPIAIAPSSWGKGGAILDSPYRYMIPRVCNTWTVQTMEACGCQMDPFGATTANGVIRQAEKRGNDFQKIWDAYDKK